MKKEQRFKKKDKNEVENEIKEEEAETEEVETEKIFLIILPISLPNCMLCRPTCSS